MRFAVRLTNPLLKSQIAVQNTNLINDDAEQQPLDGELCHNNAVFDLEWVPGQMQLVSASGSFTKNISKPLQSMDI